MRLSSMKKVLNNLDLFNILQLDPCPISFCRLDSDQNSLFLNYHRNLLLSLLQSQNQEVGELKQGEKHLSPPIHLLWVLMFQSLLLLYLTLWVELPRHHPLEILNPPILLIQYCYLSFISSLIIRGFKISQKFIEFFHQKFLV